jgi:hypothetical protein
LGPCAPVALATRFNNILASVVAGMSTQGQEPTTSTPRRGGSTSRWSVGRVVALVVASVAGLVGLLLLLGGLGLVGLEAFARDSDGYFTTDDEALETDQYAITAEDIDLGADPVEWSPDELLGTIRIRAGSDSGKPTFIGIGTQTEVEAYLANVGHARLSDLDPISYEVEPGGRPTAPPGREDFWVAQVEGTGEQTLEWDSEGGVWAAAIMNANGARAVAIEADVAAQIHWLLEAGLVLIGVGILLLVSGAAATLVLSRRASRQAGAES